MIDRQFDPEKNKDLRVSTYLDLSWLEPELFEKMSRRKDPPTPTHDRTARNRGRHRGCATHRFRRSQRTIGGICRRQRRRRHTGL